MDSEKNKKLAEYFPVGTKYGYYRDRSERCWDKDFKNMQDCGMDAVRIHANWGTIEPNEGEFDFDYTDRILAKANEYGMKVIFTLYLVCSPEWIYEKHPDSKYTSAGGTQWTSHTQSDAATGGWPGLCYDSMPHRETVENFLKAIAEHYKGDDRILAFDVLHEPTEEPCQQYYQIDWHEMIYCHCEHSKALFREWLKNKYGSLEKLNEVWVRQYQRWDQVHPPKSIGMYTDWLDWKNFRVDAQVDSIQFLSDTVKKYDSGRCTVVHLAIYETGHPFISSNDHFKLAPITDMIGSSMYDTVNPEVTAFVCDLLRSSSPSGKFWAAETGSGAGPMFVFMGDKPEEHMCFSLPITGAEMKRNSWAQIARGAKGVVFWGWRPELSTLETISLGFTERDGELSERSQALKEFNTALSRFKHRLAGALAPESDTAILYNMDSLFIEGLICCGKTASPLINTHEKFYKDTISLVGAYKLCMKSHIQPDFINKEKVLDGELNKYKLLILPYSISLTAQLAAKIETFVKNGGKVISDALCGYFTDDGWGSEVCPAGGLDKVFGLSVKSHYDVIDERDVVFDGKAYNHIGKMISERFMLKEGAKAVADYTDGTPAIVTNDYGKGKAVYIGTMFFGNAVWNFDENTDEVFKKVLEKADYSPEITVIGNDAGHTVETRMLCDEKGTFIFVLNHSKDEFGVEISVPVGFDGSAQELITQTKLGKDAVKNGVFKVKEILKPDEVKVYLCSK